MLFHLPGEMPIALGDTCFSLSDRRRGSAGMKASGFPKAREIVRSAEVISCRRRAGQVGGQYCSEDVGKAQFEDVIAS